MFSTKLIGAKKTALVACAFLAAMVLFSCTYSSNKVIASLGRYENREFYTSGGFQDFTDYAKYSFRSVDSAKNQYLHQIQDDDLDMINVHLDDFESWVRVIRESYPTNELSVHYDFDRAMIDLEDYIYIESEEHTWSDGHTSLINYNVYFFDTQTQVLYYFHNNI